FSEEEFRKYLKDNETDFIRFKTRLLLDEAKNDPVRRANLVREVVRSIAVIPDQINRTIYVKECSLLLGMPEEVVLDEVMKLRKQQSFRDRNTWPVQDAIVTPQAVTQRQKKSEKTSYYSEKEILRLLIRYGAEVLSRVTDKETGTETITTVADYIISEIEEDELKLDDPVFARMYEEIKLDVKQGMIPGERHFVHHPEPAISAAAVDMLTERYTLSPIWNTRGAYVETEEMKLKEMVPETVLSFKSDKLKILQKEILREITLAKGDDERVAVLQEQFRAMTSLQKKIAYSLGKRVI
ncbi:MAG: hypothetical protein L0Y37_03545, partial [Bacteroidales bacterium]|nr:hypothetical protein [Bacteroidales bacterium]